MVVQPTLVRMGIAVLVLMLYQRVLPNALNATGVLWAAVFLLYFLLAHGLAHWSGVRGLRGLGLDPQRGWHRQLGLGLAIGAGAWLLLTAGEFAVGRLRFIAWNPPAAVTWHITQAVVLSALGSAANDVALRGFIFAHLRNRLPVATIVLLSTALYTIDDFALGGFTLANTLFSIVMGLAFALAVARHHTLWMNVGLHAGVNIVYWSTYGFGAGRLRSGVAQLAIDSSPAWTRYLGIFAACLLFVVVVLVLRAGRAAAGVELAGMPRVWTASGSERSST